MAWKEVLMPTKSVLPYDLPSPPPPPPDDDDDDDMDGANAYEPLDPFLSPRHKRQQKEDYTQIDVKSLDPPPFYGDQMFLKQTYNQNQCDREKKMTIKQSSKVPDPPPEIKIEMNESQSEVNLRERVPVNQEKRQSRRSLFTTDQWELIMQMFQNLPRKQDNLEPDTLYDDISSSPQHGHEKVWAKDGDGIYVDINEIEDTYEPIPADIPKQNFYYNIHDKPPLPPKSPHRCPSFSGKDKSVQQSAKHSGSRPVIPPKPKHRLAAKASSIGIFYC